jgi:(p)ppGpp synthase/HD superfamily hydrolase
MYQQALMFIARKHAGQKRRNGNPYIIHPIRVSQEVHSITEKVVALLHDVVEDTDATFADIERLFGPEVCVAVEALTHRKGESYDDYIRRVKVNPISAAVKIADIADNLADSPSDHAIEKSARALDILVCSST